MIWAMGNGNWCSERSQRRWSDSHGTTGIYPVFSHKVSSFLIFSLFVGLRGDLKCFGIFFLSQIKISAFGFNLHRILWGQ